MTLKSTALGVLVFVACGAVPGVNFVSGPLAPLIAGFTVGFRSPLTKIDGLILGALLGLLVTVIVVAFLAFDAGGSGSSLGLAGGVAVATGFFMWGLWLTYAGTRLGIRYRLRKGS